MYIGRHPTCLLDRVTGPCENRGGSTEEADDGYTGPTKPRTDMKMPKYTEIFVPGGYPRYTYNPRLSLRLEHRLRQVLENLCKLVTVTGHTKSGKTVLVRSILPRAEAVWVDGGGIGEEDDFWNTVIDQLELFQTVGTEVTRETSAEVSASASGGANLLVAKGEAEVGGSLGTTRGKGTSKLRTVSSKVAALAGLRDAGIPLVVDDFHYLPRELQGGIVRALKPLIFDGHAAVIIAIPHRRYDAVKVEKEMTGRILQVEIPGWTSEELDFIPETGFPMLKGSVSQNTADTLARESIGSPHLMQEFCRAICRARGITDSFEDGSADLEPDALKRVFSETAETIGRPIFEKLARGPRQRSDRIPRSLKAGGEVDIYGLVLHALAHIRPGLVTLEYADLRAAIREVCAQETPQLHEVARVLKHMSDIAATDQSSTPVIDFDEEEKTLHVTDPFFAFYLRWGDLNG